MKKPIKKLTKKQGGGEETNLETSTGTNTGKDYTFKYNTGNLNKKDRFRAQVTRGDYDRITKNDRFDQTGTARNVIKAGFEQGINRRNVVKQASEASNLNRRAVRKEVRRMGLGRLESFSGCVPGHEIYGCGSGPSGKGGFPGQQKKGGAMKSPFMMKRGGAIKITPMIPSGGAMKSMTSKKKK